MKIADYREYAILSNLSYILWNSNLTSDVDEASSESEIVERTPKALVEEIFIDEGWEIRHFQENIPETGFAACLFSKSNEKVLAIRGTETNTSNDWSTDVWEADIYDIGLIGVAINQATSMFNYIMRLTAQQGQTDVVQLRWREEAIGEGHPVPNNGSCIQGEQHGTSTTYFGDESGW